MGDWHIVGAQKISVDPNEWMHSLFWQAARQAYPEEPRRILSEGRYGPISLLESVLEASLWADCEEYFNHWAAWGPDPWSREKWGSRWEAWEAQQAEPGDRWEGTKLREDRQDSLRCQARTNESYSLRREKNMSQWSKEKIMLMLQEGSRTSS